MMHTVLVLWVLAIYLVAALPTNFSISLGFGSHMVLQHGAQSHPMIWGFDVVGSMVSVRLNNQTLPSNATDATGLWRVRIPNKPAGGPYVIDVSSTSGGHATLVDVYFGSVFVCGGQSNMQFSLHGAFNATAEIADAGNHPLIRVFTVGQGSGMNIPNPLQDFVNVEQPWSVSSPTSIGNGDFTYFSAICYLFARNLQASQPSMPMGMISANWGGTCLSSWTPSDGEAVASCGMTGTSGHANLYNALINPLVVGPMALEGFLFSQGECDADCNNTAFYTCAFAKFINDWRGKFRVPEAFFSFQVLPAYINDSGRFSPFSLPYERVAQLQGLLAGPHVYATNTIDLGDALGPYGSVHPRNKQDVAKRMAAAAQALVFGDRTVPYLSPTYASAAYAVEGNDLTVTVTFAPAPPNSGVLSLRPAACPVAQAVPLEECAWFDVQTADGVWQNATGVALTADNAQLVLTVHGVGGQGKPNATRGFFSPWPVVVLYSQEGLPVMPWWESV